MSIVQDVNKSLSWIKVASMLNLKVLSAALPARTNCPLCGDSRFLIFADQSTAGQWHYCAGCKSKGSLVHLVSRVWKLDTLATLTKLHAELQTLPKEALTEKGANDYDSLSLAQHDRLEEFWTTAQSSPWLNDPQLLNISKFDIISTTSTKEWTARTIDEIVGALDARELYEFFTGDKVKRDNNTMKKIFGDSDWRGVLVMPFYDMPGRINALLCLGREGDPDKDVKLAQVVSHRDAGLQFHPKLLENKPDYLIAMEDPNCYLLASIRHYNVTRSPANFVLWHAGKDVQTQPTAWDMVGSGKEIIFWNPTLSKETIKQAMKVNGLLSTFTLSGRTPKTIYNKIATKPVVDLTRSIKKTAKPWPKALDIIVESMTDAELEEFYFQLGLTDRELDQALRYCSYATCLRLDSITSSKPICRTLIYDGKQIEARPDGWFHLHGDVEELIVDANLRIDSVIHYPATNKSLYAGAIEYSGTEYPFTEEIKVIESAPMSWMRDTLIKHKAGLLRYNPKWNRKIASIATMLQKPKCQIGIEKVGWDSDQKAMVLPRFSVTLDGDIQVNFDQAIDETLPACNLPMAQDFTPEELEPLLDNTEENAMFWGLWCLFAANIIAPIFTKSPLGIAVHGFTSRNATNLVADTMELAEVTPQEIHKNTFRPIHTWLYKYGLSGDVKNSEMAKFLNSLDEDFNVVVRTSWYQTLSLLLSGNWHAVMVDDILNLPITPTEVQKALLPSYIRYAISRPARDFIHENNFALAVVNDVYSWLSAMNVDASVVRKGPDKILYRSDTLYAEKFGEMLTQFIDDGDLTIAAKAASSDNLHKRLRLRTEMVEMPEYGGILVSDAAVMNCLAKHNAPPISTFILTKRLLAANAIVGEIELGTATGWILRFDWWDSVSHRYRIRRMKTFNIVG